MRLFSTRGLACLTCCLASLLAGGCAMFRKPPRRVEVAHERLTTPSGVEVLDVTCGTGPAAEPGDTVAIEYTGRLADGTIVDDTEERGVPARFVIGEAPLPGWNEGVTGMRLEGRRQLWIPPEVAYGDEGYPGLVPPAATLEFDVRLIELERR